MEIEVKDTVENDSELEITEEEKVLVSVDIQDRIDDEIDSKLEVK